MYRYFFRARVAVLRTSEAVATQFLRFRRLLTQIFDNLV